ncbi:MAG: hypothetical protein APF82_05340 [Sphingomonadales bacterium BRH_c42]|nr:MAG: hypothetical protein APF82_05340 [Sphingomonadales bacterium BRH_c42]
MARKFLYLVAAVIVLVISALIVLRIWASELTALALVPTAEFTEQPALADNAYADPALWYSHPGMGAADPARWQPGFDHDQSSSPGLGTPTPPPFAVFFVHPTSYLDRSSWNARLGEREAERIARVYLRGMASPFSQASEIWAPRYRQATFGAFLTDAPEAQRAIDLAYHDVRQAFAQFRNSIAPDMPIVLAGHSQGSLHLLRLLREEVRGTPLAERLVATYAIGWPVSIEHDLPELGVPACTAASQTGCLLSWSSFAEPADPSFVLEGYAGSIGFDGKPRGDGAIVCTNPLTGASGRDAATAQINRGTLVPGKDLSDGNLVARLVPARCDTRGLLLIGDPPEMGRYVLPGNNYHVYDIPLFWANVQADVARRAISWANSR